MAKLKPTLSMNLEIYLCRTFSNVRHRQPLLQRYSGLSSQGGHPTPVITSLCSVSSIDPSLDLPYNLYIVFFLPSLVLLLCVPESPVLLMAAPASWESRRALLATSQPDILSPAQSFQHTFGFESPVDIDNMPGPKTPRRQGHRDHNTACAAMTISRNLPGVWQ